MKIVECIDWYYPGARSGGPIISLHNELLNLKNPTEITVLTRNKDIDGTTYSIAEMMDFQKKIPYRVRYLKGNYRDFLLKIRAIKNSDIIKINGMYSIHFGLLFILISRFTAKKLIFIRPRGMLSTQAFKKKAVMKRYYLIFLDTLLSKTTIFLATSEQEMGDVNKYFPRFTCKIERDPTRKIVKINKDDYEKERKIKLLYSGRISKEKGELELIRYCKLNSLGLTLVGSNNADAYYQECREIIDDTANIIYRDHLDWNNLRKIYLDSEILISFSFGENFGHSIYEALMLGCNVVIRTNTTIWDDFGGSVFTFNSPAGVQSAIHQARNKRNYPEYLKLVSDLRLI